MIENPVDEKYIERIRKMYAKDYDAEGSHGWNGHIVPVYQESKAFAEAHPEKLNGKIVFLAAALHDAAIKRHGGRELHEENGAKMLLRDKKKLGLTDEEARLAAEAIQDHRNSKKYDRLKQYGTPWRSVYGEILASSDRGAPSADPEVFWKRPIAYGLENFPDWTDEALAHRAYDHAQGKHADPDPYLPQMWKDKYQDLQEARVRMVKETPVEWLAKRIAEERKRRGL